MSRGVIFLINDDIEMENFNFPSENEQNPNIDKIKFNKILCNLSEQSRNAAKSTKCYYCGKECSSFCNSHSVPVFCLKNIAVNGEVFYSNKLINFPYLKDKKGIKASGTFNIICRDCDSQIFSDYENPNNLLTRPTDKMLAQISLKNYLYSISKRLFEIQLYDNINDSMGMDVLRYINQQDINYLDLNEYINEFKATKRIIEKGLDNCYYLFYWEKLNYVVPIAFQDNIALISDISGKLINNVYNLSSDYKTKNIHICIFPLEKESIVMMFVEKSDTRYRHFRKSFNNLSSEDKLSLINYIIFCYSEDFFLYKGLDKNILNNEKLMEVSKKTSIAILSNPYANPLKKSIDNFDLSKRNEIPNLLLEKYQVK